MQGWIKLHRNLANSDLWLSEPFSRGQAWVDLLMLANHKPGHIRKRGVRIDLQAGECGWSERELAARWQWSRGKIRRFFDELEKDERIERKTVPQKKNVTGLFKILNYCSMQTDGTTNDTTDGPQTDRKQYLNKNEKKEKKEKKKDSLSGLRFAVISHLNERTGTSFKADTQKTRELIKARCGEGFTEQDFFRAIDNMVGKWGHDDKMRSYLRPLTLFGNKMESYVNETTGTGATNSLFAGAI